MERTGSCSGSRRLQWHGRNFGLCALAAALIISIALVSAFLGVVPAKKEQILLQCPLPVPADRLPVYQVQKMDSEACIALGMAIGEAVGAEYDSISYREDSAFFVDKDTEGGVHLLMIENSTGGFTYHSQKPKGTSWTEGDRKAMEIALEPFGIQIPASAEFSVEEDGWHSFRIDCTAVESGMAEGSVRCRYADDGTVRELENNLVEYTDARFLPSISGKEAYRRLCGGDFLKREGIPYEILECKLVYMPDGQGQCVPGYRFHVASQNGQEPDQIWIPAIEETGQ